MIRTIHEDPNHGKGLVMYKNELKPGTYQIPETQGDDWSCISLVFKKKV